MYLFILTSQPLTFVQVTNGRNPTTSSCTRTVKQRCRELDTIRSIVSGGESSVLMQEELRMLSDEERKDLLQKSGISTAVEISAEQGLAIKAGLSLPWFRLRHLKRFDINHTGKFRNANKLYCRWLKASGVSIGCEEKMQFPKESLETILKGKWHHFLFLWQAEERN